MFLIQKIYSHTQAHKAMIALRYEVLRKPLGLRYTDAELANDEADTLWGIYENNTICGCCIITKLSSNSWKMRQVAVAASHQSKGIGSLMLHHIEQEAKHENVHLLQCHARATAVAFYTKNNWTVEGESFEEVGISHYKMYFEV